MVVTAIVLAVVVAGLLSMNRLIAMNRDRLLARAARATGRHIDVKEVTVNLWGQPGVDLSDVLIGDDPAFGDAAFLSAQAVTLRLAVWPLLRGKLDVARVEFTQPQVRVVRAADGRFNASTIGRWRAPRVHEEVPDDTAEARGRAAAWVVPVADLAMSDATLLYVDETAVPPRTLTFRRVDLHAWDIGSGEAVPFEVTGTFDGHAENIRVSGELLPDPVAERIGVIARGSVGPLGAQVPRVENLELRGHWYGERFEIDRLHAEVFGGDLDLSGVLPLREAAALQLRGRGRRLTVGDMLATHRSAHPLEIEGEMSFDADVGGVGQDWARLSEWLTGSGTAVMRGGTLPNFNLLAEVTRRVTGVPGVPELLSADVRAKYERALASRETRFDELRLRFRIGEGRFLADEVVMRAQDFRTTASGWIGFDRHADLHGVLELSDALSADVVGDVKHAKIFANDAGRLALPFRYRGIVGQARPQLDGSALKPVFRRALRGGEVERLVDEVLGGRRKRTGGGMAPPAPPPQRRELPDR
jgi:hypothetical protein